MPKLMIEFQGKVIASATPFDSASRASGADTCTLVPPSTLTIWPTVPLAGRIFMPLIWPGSVMGCFEWKVPTCRCARQTLTSFISCWAYERYQASSAFDAGPGLSTRNGSSAAAMIGKRPAW
jgi:hypothetical protein